MSCPTRSAAENRPDIKALGIRALGGLMEELGQPSYRVGQLVSWLYGRGARSFDDMTDIPAGLRASLAGRFEFSYPEVAQRQVSSDGTRKYLLALGDGVTVETVGLPAGDRLTVCFSTQAGCAMGCSFCATGRSGLTRNLTPGEMVDQLAVVAHDFGVRVTNAVAMGQGEPFANYDHVLDALRLMNHAKGLGIGARHLTVSTCGIIQGIRRFSAEPEQFTLAVSLHSAVQRTRDELMPGVRGVRLAQVREALVAYGDITGRRPSIEYALIDGINDTEEHLAALVAFCRGMLVHVNLIPMNRVTGTSFERSSDDATSRFERGLSAAHIEHSIRAERGSDIDAACGQLQQRAIDS